MSTSLNKSSKKVSIIKNYLYNLSYQLLLLVVPLITMPYLSRVLGLANQGTFSVLYSVVSCFVMLGCIGLNIYGQREIAYYKNSEQDCNRIFWEISIIRFVMLFASLVLYFLFIWFNFNVIGVINVYNPVYFMLFAIELVASMFDISWYFQGVENFRIQTIRNFIVKLIGLAMIFVFVRTENDLWLYIVIYTGMNLIGNASLWIYKLKGCRFVKPDIQRMRHHLGRSFIMFLPQIATTVYSQLDRLMLGVLMNDGNVQAGVYDNAEKIVKMALTVVTSIGLVMLSRVANTYIENNKQQAHKYITASFRMYLTLAVPIMFGVAGIAKTFVPRFFSDEPGFDQIVPVMIMLSPIILFIGGSNVFGTQYLLPTNRMKAYTLSVFVGMGVNLVLNTILIKGFGALGAAAATVVAEFCVLVVQMIAVRKEFSPKLYLKGWRNYISGAIMFVCVYMIGQIVGSTIYTVVAQLIVGVTVYFGLLLLLRDPFVLSGARMALGQLRTSKQSPADATDDNICEELRLISFDETEDVQTDQPDTDSAATENLDQVSEFEQSGLTAEKVASEDAAGDLSSDKESNDKN